MFIVFSIIIILFNFFNFQLFWDHIIYKNYFFFNLKNKIIQLLKKFNNIQYLKKKYNNNY